MVVARDLPEVGPSGLTLHLHGPAVAGQIMPRRARPRFLAREPERPRLLVPVPQLLVTNRQRQEEAVPAVARREGVLTSSAAAEPPAGPVARAVGPAHERPWHNTKAARPGRGQGIGPLVGVGTQNCGSSDLDKALLTNTRGPLARAPLLREGVPQFREGPRRPREA